MNLPLHGLRDAHQRYEQLRSIAREVTPESLSETYQNQASIKLAATDNEVLKASETTSRSQVL